MSLKRFAKSLAFIVLLLVTAWGVWSFLKGDPGAALEYWKSRTPLLLLVALLAVLDVTTEAIAWMWAYARFGVRSWDLGGLWSFLAGRAGLLVPAQLGRLLSPDAMARLGRGPLETCIKAEVVAFAINIASVGILILMLALAYVHVWLAPIVLVGSLASIYLLGDRVGALVKHTRLALPPVLWRSRSTLAIVMVKMMGWVFHGVGLWVIIAGLSADASVVNSILFSSAAAVLGVGTGLPGGIGATEGLLAFGLDRLRIPSEYLMPAIASFRVITFWVWIPIGWWALLMTRRRANSKEAVGMSPAVQA